MKTRKILDTALLYNWGPETPVESICGSCGTTADGLCPECGEVNSVQAEDFNYSSNRDWLYETAHNLEVPLKYLKQSLITTEE